MNSSPNPGDRRVRFWPVVVTAVTVAPPVTVEPRIWYNPELRSTLGYADYDAKAKPFIVKS